MPQGQGQGRGFCWDFAHPSQVVQGGAAELDATEGPLAIGGQTRTAAAVSCQGASIG